MRCRYMLLLLAHLALAACGEDSNQESVVLTADATINSQDGGLGPIPVATSRYAKSSLDDSVNGPAFTTVADLNGDGRLDLIVSEFGNLEGNTIKPGALNVYLQGDTLDQWQKQEITTPQAPLYWPNSVHVADIDGDGDKDLTVGAGFLICEILPRVDGNGDMVAPGPCGGLMWYEQTDNGWVRHDVVSDSSALFYHHGLLADIDADGFLDLVTVGERRSLGLDGQVIDDAQAQWFRGEPSATRFETTPRTIGPGMGSLAELVDVDGDGDTDLLSAEYFAPFAEKSFAWYENVEAPTAGNPNGVWTRHVIDDAVGPAIQFKMVPGLFGDDREVAVGVNHTQTTGDDPDPWESAVFVYTKPADPKQRWTRTQISKNIVSKPRANQAAPGIFDHGDVDGDGDIDLLVSGDGDSRVFLLLQEDDQTFTTWVFDEEMPQAGSINIGDLNGDSIPELIVSSFDNNGLYMYTQSADGPHPLRQADVPDWAGSQGGSLRINYDGDATGKLVVGLFETWPPMGPPAGFQLFDDPSYPVLAEFPAVAPGDYVALAFIDVDGSGIMGPNEGDVETTVDVSLPTASPVDVFLDGNGGGPGPMPMPQPGGPNAVRIEYTGNEMGPLVVAMFSSWPPMGPPAAFEQVAAPAFPVDLNFPNIPAGSYTALAFIDVDGSGPMSATAEDVQARAEFTFPSQAAQTIDLGGPSGVPGLQTIRTELDRGGRVTPVVVHVPEAGDNLPLVLFNPGFQLESAAYRTLCETLAAEGFAVARLDPPGTIFDVNHLEMAADVRNALTWLLQDSEISNRLNANAVGTMGHSLGGKLAIMNGIEDPRVSAVFAIDPVDGDPSPLPDPSIRPNLAPGPISGLTAPLGLIGETTNASSANAFVPACAPQEENFQTFFDGATSSDWVAEWNILGADHMDFVETCPPGPFSPCSLCDEGTLDAARVRRITTDLVVAFFRYHFASDGGMEAMLLGADLPQEVQLRQR